MPRTVTRIPLHWAFLFATACGDPFPAHGGLGRGAASGAGGEAALTVTVTAAPAAALESVEPVTWLWLTTSPPEIVEPSRVFLYEGELSSYHLGRLAREELPQTMRDRQVPMTTIAAGKDTILLAPQVELVPDSTYSLATPELGIVARLGVASESERPALRREWPPVAGETSARRAVLCAPFGVALDVPRETWKLGDRGELSVGPWPEAEALPRCSLVELSGPLGPGDLLPLPPMVGGFSVPPSPPSHREAPPIEPVLCLPTELALGPGCLLVADDRASFRGPSPAVHVSFTPGGVGGELRHGESIAVPNLAPSSTFSLRASFLLPNGESRQAEVSGRTGAPEPHLVINEVMANPRGPEPEAEWIELVNDGQEPVALEGWTLADLAVEFPLPAAQLTPGQHAVVVSASYIVDPEVDVAPAAGVLLLRVDRLGQAGLANSGELLRLRSPDGVVRSRFPAVASSEAGVSVARRAPWASDDAPASFGLHADPGASPGRGNELRDEASVAFAPFSR